MSLVAVFSVLVLVFWFLRYRKARTSWKVPVENFPLLWRVELAKNVVFYNALSVDEKMHFEFKIQEFLLNCRVTGIDTDLSDTDRLLVAASAIIPIFQFKDWRYLNLDEVLVYPASFNAEFESSGGGRSILGMVGTGYMDGKMILSKRALEQGCANERDKKIPPFMSLYTS